MQRAKFQILEFNMRRPSKMTQRFDMNRKVSIEPSSGQSSFENNRSLKRRAIVFFKALISIGLIVFLVTRLDYPALISYWRRFDVIWVVGALTVLFFVTCVLAGTRLNLMLASVKAARAFRTTAQIAICGLFFEQVTIGFVAGDAIRLWLLRRTNVPLGTAIQALLLDRAMGFANLILLSLIGIHALLPLLDETTRRGVVISLAIFFVVGGAGITIFLFLATFSRFSSSLTSWRHLWTPRQIANNGFILATVFALALMTHLLNVLVFWMLGQSLALSLSLYQWFLVVPTVLLISMMPISAGGWGIREGAMVVVLKEFGVPPEQAVLTSVLFGLCAVIATLPGGIFWVVDKRFAEKKFGNPV
jgi:glycosyltransferase 2 family protein